ncbi:MAG: hypothetical protein U9Q82_00360, partial [Chloroflexota bacterium]|nr:hypothetical protein [Chloroflexota bacterium]
HGGCFASPLGKQTLLILQNPFGLDDKAVLFDEWDSDGLRPSGLGIDGRSVGRPSLSTKGDLHYLHKWMCGIAMVSDRAGWVSGRRSVGRFSPSAKVDSLTVRHST